MTYDWKPPEELVCGATVFRLGDMVEYKSWMLNKLTQGPITHFHPSVFGDHQAQVKVSLNGTLLTCELVDLEKARKI